MDGPVLSAPNICYELAEKTKAIAHGGIGAIHRLVQRVGLATRIDTDVRVLKVHQPYYESDHVLNIAYNLRGGGQTLDDIELRRTDRVFLDALGTDSLPDPTTAGDFCRRFDEEQIEALMDAINETRLEVWQRCPGLVEETARIDGDGTLVPTTGACKEGMDIAYNGVWGYGPLLVSLANTGEPLFIKNRSANRPSHESAIPYVDKAVALCRRAGFTDVLWRGDTDFALTTAFDRWTDRDTLLSPRLLPLLRAYWQTARPRTWLFPSPCRPGPLNPSGLQRAYRKAKRRAGITKPGGIHGLHHAIATHLLEAGVDVHTIQRLLGHRSLTTTSRYWHLTHALLTTQAERLDLLAPDPADAGPA